MKHTSIVFAALLSAFLLAGCNIPNPVTSTTLPSVTPGETATEPVSDTETPEPDPTLPPSPTGLPTEPPPPITVEVAIANPGFEGRFVDGYGGLVPEGWQGWACENCPAIDGRVTNKPEFVPIQAEFYPNRVHEDAQAVKMIRSYEPLDAGLYTDFDTPPGATSCDVSAWVQLWLANEWSEYYYARGGPFASEYSRSQLDDLRARYGGYGRIGFSSNGEPIFDDLRYTSDRATADDKGAGWVQLGTGSVNSNPAVPASMVYSEPFGYQELENGSYTIYDNWTLISARLPAFDGKTRLVIRTVNKYGMVHNDRYFDDVTVTCEVPAPEATPNPTATGTPAATATPGATQATPPPVFTATPLPPSEPVEDCTAPPCYVPAKVEYTVLSNGLNIRTAPRASAPLSGSYARNQAFFVRCLYIVSESELWASTDECTGGNWSAIYIGQATFAEPSEGPLGLR